MHTEQRTQDITLRPHPNKVPREVEITTDRDKFTAEESMGACRMALYAHPAKVPCTAAPTTLDE